MAALEPSEVLETLVREAEPILEQLGVSNAKGKELFSHFSVTQLN